MKSRFSWGIVAKIDPPDYETRIAILKKKAAMKNITISDEVLFFIDEKTATINIEELIYQAIELETPIVLYCPDCTRTHENLSEDEEVEESDLDLG